MKNKMIIGALIALVAVGVFFVIGNKGGNVRHVERKIFGTNTYTEQEINDAMDVVVGEFKKEAKGCKLIRLWYDEEYSDLQAPGWKAQYNAKDAIVLLSDFSVDSSGGDGSLEPNSNYSNWQWILVRNDQGWEIMTSGY